MKKLIFLLSITLLFISCVSGIESDAKKRMKLTIKELAKDPNIQISDIKVLFQTDSLAIIQCVTRGINGFGGYSRNEMEYLYAITDDGKVMEKMTDKDKHQGVYSYTLNVLKANREFNSSSTGKNPSEAVKKFMKNAGIDTCEDSVQLFKRHILSEIKSEGRIIND